jgi:hypothetical protein
MDLRLNDTPAGPSRPCPPKLVAGAMAYVAAGMSSRLLERALP